MRLLHISAVIKGHDYQHPERFCELRPPDPLPTVDLSLSLESRFLSRPALNRKKRFVRRHRAISIASWLALAAYFAAVLVSVAIGRAIALACILFWIPVMVASIALLRYEVLRLLVRSYDFWPCSCINTSTFLVLGVVMGGDFRALAPLAAWAGVQSNIMIDANIRGVKVWAILNVVGVINCSLTWVAISLDLIGEVHDLPLVRLKAHELPASAFVASGLLTVTALVARNVYRKRHVFRKRANRSVIECVSYRVNLRFQVCFVLQQRAVSSVLPPSDPARPEYEKTMKYAKRIGVIDAQRTLLEQLCRARRYHLGAAASGAANIATGGNATSSVGRWSASFESFGIMAMLASVCSVFVDIYSPISRMPVFQIFALALTIAHCATFALHHQRDLFRELCACFDVLFLSSQLLVVHISVCGIFEFGNSETYIDEVVDYEPLKDKKLVAIDPNMSDLLYCVNSDTKEQTRFRYTQDTRRKETKAKKYRDYIQQEVIDGKRVDEWEAELSAYNRKTTDFESFKAYVTKKNEVNRRLSPMYNQYIFRKLKLGGYMRRQITEARLLKRFEKLFGSGADAIVAIGDWSQRQHRRFNEPAKGKGKGFRTMFRNAGYDAYLVDEFRTSSSSRCSECKQGECKTFRVCENPRACRSGKILRHGLVRCTTCSRLWDRDTNAASNIWKLASSAIRGKGRPAYLRRATGHQWCCVGSTQPRLTR